MDSLFLHFQDDQNTCLLINTSWPGIIHYDDIIMGAMASQITSLTIVYSTVYSDADQRKHQSSALLAICAGNVSIGWRHHVFLPSHPPQIHIITSLSPRQSGCDFINAGSNWLQVNICSGNGFGAIRHQAITWTNVDADLCCHVVSLAHNELIYTCQIWMWLRHQNIFLSITRNVPNEKNCEQ